MLSVLGVRGMSAVQTNHSFIKYVHRLETTKLNQLTTKLRIVFFSHKTRRINKQCL